MNVPTRIKFCGLTREADVDLAVELGVDMIGLVFAQRSPRWLGGARAAALRARIPAHVAAVALVMDAATDDIAQILAQVRPDCLQFHGAEPEAFCASFGMPYIKAIALGGSDPQDAQRRIRAWPSACAVLLDGHAPGAPGGSGQSFDWSRMPDAGDRRVLLAGGLHPDNVAEAIRLAQPWGVDVSSGLELAPGIKDPAKMRAFVAAVRDIDRRLAGRADPN